MSLQLDRAVPVTARRRETTSARLVLTLFERGKPSRLGSDADPETVVVALLDEAHALLTSHEVADLLIRADRALEPLRRGDAPRRPAPGISQRPGGPTPRVRVYLRSITVALHAAAGGPAVHPLDRTALAHRLSARIEEVAVRPVASAVV